MYFNNINKKKRKKNKKIKVKFESHISIKTVEYFLNQYPQLSAGRKNYKKKEIAIAKNICLTKLFKYAKKNNAIFIEKIHFEKKTNKIIATAILNL